MINVYDANTTNFDNNGLAVLNEAILCTSTQELNKTRTLELEYPIDKREKYLQVKGLNIIKAGGQLYRIPLQSNIQMDSNSVKVSANHIFYDLNNDFNDDTRATNKSVADALTIAISVNSKFRVGACSDLGLNTAYFINESPTESIYSKILDRWGGELQCNNFEVSIKSRIGRDTGILISYGKNIQGFEQTLDWGELATRIKLKGKDGLVIDLVNEGSSYITSPRVYDYPFIITKEVKFENIEDATELKNEGLKLWGIADLPSCNFKVVFADLSKTNEYKEFKEMLTLELGDSVIIRHKIFKCDLSARVIKIIKNEITDTIISLELGQFKDNLHNRFYTIDKKIQYTQENVEEAKEDLNETKTIVFQNTEKISLQAHAVGDLNDRVNDAELLITADAITNTVTSSQKYIGDINGLDSRLDSAELKITSDAIIGTVTKSTTYINNLNEKITAEQSSTIAQTASNVEIGFNKINNYFSFSTGGMRCNHVDGSYTVISNQGLTRYVAATGQSYHYLKFSGSISKVNSGSTYRVYLPDEFRGKNYLLDWWAGNIFPKNPTDLVFSSNVNLISEDKNNASFVVEASLMVRNPATENSPIWRGEMNILYTVIY